jgi:hypothetical protein
MVTSSPSPPENSSTPRSLHSGNQILRRQHCHASQLTPVLRYPTLLQSKSDIITATVLAYTVTREKVNGKQKFREVPK